MDWLITNWRFVLTALGLLIGAGLLIPWDKLPSLSLFTKPDDDVGDLQAAKRLVARFNRTGCVEGKAAMQAVLQHFFHEGGA